MSNTDIHKDAFDEGTKAKLELYRLYIREWLPVFLKDSNATYERLEIYDFFAGEGQDAIESPGSPLILLDELKSYCSALKTKKTKLSILFNDYSTLKCEKLNEAKNIFLSNCSKKEKYGFCNTSEQQHLCPFDLVLENSDFGLLFEKLNKGFKANKYIPRFMFIDQYGIKHVTKQIFKELVELPKTDFLFFISSSFLKRFKELPEFSKYIDDNGIDFSYKKQSHCHRVVFEYYKRLIPKQKYFLGQFSIKKGSNIHGLIFGSNNHLGMKKFLDVAWKIDPFTGEANHDIDEDPIRTGQLSLNFDECSNKIKKLYFYEQNLLMYLRTQKSNKEIYVYSLEQGINIPNTNEILRRLEKEEKIDFSGDKRIKGGFYLDYNHKKEIFIKSK